MKININQQFKNFLNSNNIIFDTTNYKNEVLSITNIEYVKLLNQIDQIITDQVIINISQISNLKQFIPLLYACLATENGIACLKLFQKYKTLIAPLNISIIEDDEILKITIDSKAGLPSLPRFLAINELLLINDLLNQELKIKPLKIGCTYTDCQPIKELLGIAPIISDINYLVYKKADLQQPFLNRNNLMVKQIIAELEVDLHELMLENDIYTLIVSQLVDLLPSGNYSLQHISQNLLISERTIQRKLKRNNLTYNIILKDVRKSLIDFYFKLKLSTDEISILLGYSDTSSFVRAFKPLMNMTISEYKNTK